MKFNFLLWIKKNKLFFPTFLLELVYLLCSQFNEKEKWVVIIEPGGIGDYLFVRQYFKYFKLSPKYKDCKLMFVARDIYKDMVECYDKQYFDEILCYNGNLYEKDYFYRKYFLNYVNSKKIVSLINLRQIINGKTTNWNVRQHIVANIKAKEKVLDLINLYPDYENSQNKIYDKIIKTEEFNNFELERRRIFFEKLLELKIPQQVQKIPLNLDFKNEKYIVVSLCAQEKHREYSFENWKQVLNYLLSKIADDTYLVFIGSQAEKNKIDNFIKTLNNPKKCKNLAAKLLVSSIPLLMSHALFLLSVETGSIHFAHSVGCKTICISNGSCYNLFLPYKDNDIKYIFPKEFIEVLKNNGDMKEFYCPSRKFSINNIQYYEIISEIDKVMNTI